MTHSLSRARFARIARRVVFQAAGLTVMMGIATTAADQAAASDSQSNRQLAEELVREALHQRLDGLDRQARQLLEQAAEVDPTYGPAHWHQGLVEQDGQWIEAEQAVAEQERNAALREYQRIRGHFRDTVVSQMQAADWCRSRSLNDQERAHLMNVLEIKPEHEPALLRLGFQPIPGGWISSDEVEAARQQHARRQRALAKWRPQIQKLRGELHSRNRNERETARHKLLAIDDAEAIPALEEQLSRDTKWNALHVVEALRNMTHEEASLSLARHAVYSRWHDVRETAARYLRERPYDTFVPPLLATMQSPITARLAVVREGQGVRRRLMLLRERQDAFERQRLSDLSPDASLAVAIHRDNARTELQNVSVARTLNVATEQDLPAEPQAWWDWWNDHNEVYVEGQKPVRDYSREAQLARIDRIRDHWQDDRQRQTQRWIEEQRERQRIEAARGGGRRDCLAAGTPVWTSSGQVAIEQVQVGDMVLAQDIETGRLDYKVVLRTTVRPESVLVKIITGTDTFQVSGGHPFWVVGEGWVKARSLKSSMALQTLRGRAQISSVELGSNQETYNLIVDDYRTYFVGRSRTLTHDNTARRPTMLVAPGVSWD